MQPQQHAEPREGLGLRDYQLDLLARVRQSLRTDQRVICQAPTGAGKTALAVYMMGRAAERGMRSMFLVHRRELIEQTSRALWEQRLAHGLIVSGKGGSKLPSRVASVQTLVRRLDRYDEPDLIIIDEAHRAAAATYQRILDAYPRAKVVGLTATPERTDGRGLDHLFSDIQCGPPLGWLIEQGWLSDYTAYAPSNIDLSGTHTRAGDYVRDELEAAVDKPSITGDAVDHYRRVAMGRRAIAFCVSRKHAEHVAAQFTAEGIAAECVTGLTPDAQRRGALARFREGKTLILVGVDLFIEGLDVPAAEAAILLRPTQSLIVHMQALGRVLRTAPGKERAIILDHVGNLTRPGLGLPDQPREWTLEGRGPRKRKSDDESDIQVRQCPECFHVHKPAAVCPGCGHVYEANGREIEQRDGELVELDQAAIRRERKRAQGKARTVDDLIRLGVERGMKDPGGWAAHVSAARQGRKATTEEKSEARKSARGLKEAAL